ncbi:MAG: hypothetical protein JWQ96_3099 [Segetibacter sp.]|nr:hypothetical protein [Segetibacter sp.]
MKKVLGIIAILFIAAAIIYSIRANGFDIVIALGAMMIACALVIVIRILTATTAKNKELS